MESKDMLGRQLETDADEAGNRFESLRQAVRDQGSIQGRTAAPIYSGAVLQYLA